MLKNLLKVILAKKKFFPPKKTNILFFDSIFMDEISHSFSKNQISLLDIRKNEINLYVMFYSLFKFQKINFKNYLRNYIHLSNCKVVITGNDNYLYFYILKNFFPNKKFISIQNGYRNFKFYKSLKKYKNLKADYIFGLNKSFCNLYKKHIKTKTIALGSVRNNCYRINKKRSQKKRILFISNGDAINRPNQRVGGLIFDGNKFFEPDIKLLLFLSNYSLKKKLVLNVYLKAIGKTKGLKEIDFFKRRIHNDKIVYTYKKKQGSNKLYSLCDKSAITITSTSTLGLENLSRMNKTAIFNNRVKLSKKIMDIFWNYRMKKKGFFWTDENYDQKELNKILDRITGMKKTLWDSKIKKIAKELMVYDYKNRQIINLIKNSIK